MNKDIKRQLEKVIVYDYKDKITKEINILKKTKGKYLMIYGYPKAGAKVCSLEHQKLIHLIPDFTKENIFVVGYSLDNDRNITKNISSQINHYQIIDNSGSFSKAMGSKFLNFTNRSTFVWDNELNLIYKSKVGLTKQRDWKKILNIITDLKKTKISNYK